MPWAAGGMTETINVTTSILHAHCMTALPQDYSQLQLPAAPPAQFWWPYAAQPSPVQSFMTTWRHHHLQGSTHHPAPERLVHGCRTRMAGRWRRSPTDGSLGAEVDELLELPSLQRLAREKIAELEVWPGQYLHGSVHLRMQSCNIAAVLSGTATTLRCPCMLSRPAELRSRAQSCPGQGRTCSTSCACKTGTPARHPAV